MTTRATFAALLSLLIARPVYAAGVDFSPDARQIACDWAGRLAVIFTDGTGMETVPGGEGTQFVRWSPNGRSLAVITGPESKRELRLYTPVTKKLRGMGGNLRAPFAWREDGNRFACIHDLPGERAELVWYNLAENGVSFRVSLPFAVSPDAPMVWLPNTDDLAFVAADQNVYTVEAGEFKKVTTSGDVLGMNLYAGGKKLVWARRGPNLRYILMSVYAYDLTARNVTRLGFPERVQALNPNPRTAPESVNKVVFSPDGSRMLLYATLAGAKAKIIALYTVTLDGHTARQLQRDSSAAPGSMDAAWSRDSRAIAVNYSTSASRKLFTTNADGTGGRVLRMEPAR